MGHIESDDSNLYFAFMATDVGDLSWLEGHCAGGIFYTNLYIDANNNDVLDGDDHAISADSLVGVANERWVNPVPLSLLLG